jgi:hypothetical protein
MPKKKVGELLRLNVRIPLWFVLTVGVVSVFVAYFCAAAYRDQIKFTAALLAAAAAIYSAYYVGAALRMQVSRDRQKASFEILSLLNRPEFVDVRNFLEKEVEGHDSISAEALYTKIENNEKLDNAVTVVIGILEDMAVALQHDYVDEDILHESLVAIVRRNWSGLRGWVEQIRKKRNEPEIAIELQKLAASWDSGRRLSDGRKLRSLLKT